MPSNRIRVPPLPPLKALTKQNSAHCFHSSPTAYSNFIIPDLLLTGSYPDHRNELKSLLEHDFQTFVSLESKFPAQIGAKAKRIKDYSHQAELLSRDMKKPFRQITHHLDDFNTKKAPELLQFIYDKIFKGALNRGQKVYLHDIGGAGRSGVVSAIILAILHGLSGGEALGYVGKLHSLRDSAPLTGSPENTEQRLFVYHVIDKLMKQMPPPTEKWRRISFPAKPSNNNDNDTASLASTSLLDNDSQYTKATTPKHDQLSDFPDNESLLTTNLQSPTHSTYSTREDGLNDEDLDILRSDRVKEFSDMPPERSPSRSRANKNASDSGVIVNLPYSIPDSAPKPSKEMQGPIPTSNWILKDHVCVGSFPIDTRYGQQRNRQLVVDASSNAIAPVKKLLDAGITTFVCLQAEIPLLNNKQTQNADFIAYDTHLQQSQRFGFKDRAGYLPYFDTVQSLVEKKYPSIHKMTYIHFPIEEGNTVRPVTCSKLLHDLVERIKMNQKIYIHAGTGHNREAMVGAALLAVLFNMNAADAIGLMSKLHNVRVERGGVHSAPSSHKQKMSVQQMVNSFTGATSDRITVSARSQVRNDSVVKTGNQIRNRNQSTSIVFG